MKELYKSDGSVVCGISTSKIKVPSVFNSVLSVENVYTSAVAGDVQSGCANGNMVYFANITTNMIYAYNVLTQTLASASLSGLGHANGMTYCDKDNCIYIDTMNSSQGTILKIKADTLSLQDTITHSDLHSSIAWNRSTQEFYAKQSNGNIIVYDHEWNKLRTFTLSSIPSGTNQSIETDGTFIYFAWLEDTSYYVDNKQHIYVYTLDGTFLKDIKPMCSEIESLAYNGYGDYFIITAHGASGYGKINKVISYANVDVPAADGTYVLKATVSNGAITYAWIAE